MIQKSFVLILLLGVSAFGFTQSLDSTNSRNNSIGLVISPTIVGTVVNSRFGIRYKRDLNRFKFRSSLNVVLNPDMSPSFHHVESLVYVADTFVIRRVSGHSNEAFDFRIGAEKIILDKQIDLIIGADVAVGRLSRSKYYSDAFEFYNTDSITGVSTFVPCNHFENSLLTSGQNPDCEIPEEYQVLVKMGRAQYHYLKLAGHISLAVRIDLSPKFKLSTQITPEFAYYQLQSERVNDPKNLYDTPANFSQISLTNVNFILDYKF